MKTFKKITDLIGCTPLLELTNIEKNEQLEATVLGKLEYWVQDYIFMCAPLLSGGGDFKIKRWLLKKNEKYLVFDPMKS